MNSLLEYGMEHSSLDRRQRKSRIAIENALIELLQEKSLDDISISEIARKADINRKTFYNNYDTIDDVFFSIEEKLVNFISDGLPEQITIDNEIEIYNLLYNLSLSLSKQKRLLGQLFSNHSALYFKESLQNLILPYVERNLLNYNINPDIVPYVNQCVINGIFGIFDEWFHDNDNLTPKQIALLAYNMTTSLIKLDNYKDL